MGNDQLNKIAEDAFDFGSESESESESNEKLDSNSFYNTNESSSSSSSSISSSEDSLSSTSSTSDSSSSYSSSVDSSNEQVQPSNRFSALELSDSLSIPSRSVSTPISPQMGGVPSDSHMSVKLYIQMEYYENGTLDDLIQTGTVCLFFLIDHSYIKISVVFGRFYSMYFFLLDFMNSF